ncbi:hypothetical protein [Enorma massiliensis]|uniref:hypothetical protein n=1 Tax=Enorma massiliensis TaxID=1472761 RepID=UPI0013A63B4E|nr:hypothetical protein [Enorma massiliensis]
MKKTADKTIDERRDGLRVLAEAVVKKPVKAGSVDEMSLESRRRAIAYGRARGNA